MSRYLLKPVLASILALAIGGGAQAWAGATTSGGVGVGIHIAYHTPPTAKDGVFDASNFQVPGTLAAVPAVPGQTFVFSIMTQPVHGSLSLLDPILGTFEYRPDDGFKSGVDSFTFQVVDSHGLESNIATETLLFHVSTRALEGQVFTLPNTPVSGFLTANAAFPGEVLTFHVLNLPNSGTFTLLDDHTGAFTYTPAAAFTGGVTAQFRVTDPMGRSSDIGVEHIVVSAEPPVAVSSSVTTQRNHKVSGTLSATTVFTGQKLTYRLVKQALHGRVTITDLVAGTFTYRPKKGYVGKDRFQFHAVDQNNTPSGTATVTITVHR